MNAAERWAREWYGNCPSQRMNAAERWAREWYGDCPDVWMFDRDANPVTLPAEAIGFRVRRLPPGSRGLGAPVRDPVTGAWLFVPRSVGPEELADLVGYLPGRYKLVAVDERHMAVRDVPIVVFSVTPTMARQAGRMGAETAAASSAATPRNPIAEIVAEIVQALTAPNPIVLELVRTLRMVLVETFATLREVVRSIQVQAVELVRSLADLVNACAELVTAAGGAGVSRRAESQPVPVAPAAPQPDPQSTPVAAVASEPDSGRGTTLATASERPDSGDHTAAAMRSAEPVPPHLAARAGSEASPGANAGSGGAPESRSRRAAPRRPFGARASAVRPVRRVAWWGARMWGRVRARPNVLGPRAKRAPRRGGEIARDEDVRGTSPADLPVGSSQARRR